MNCARKHTLVTGCSSGIGQRGQHLGHEQRVARRAGQPGQQPLARCGAHRVCGQVRHCLCAETAQ
ncbi:MAG TPA: hypothetical protein VHS32_30650, partial [Streptosporangiaceae bacterium]|nr:hypothetical protein [Streptosporangiaceae bacterium]